MMPHGERHALGPAHCHCLDNRRDLMVQSGDREVLRSLAKVGLRLLVCPLVKQKDGHGLATAMGSVMQRRRSCVVPSRHVCLFLNQQPHHRLVTATGSGVERRLSKSSIVVPGRDIRMLLDQQPRHLLVAATCNGVERNTALFEQTSAWCSISSRATSLWP